MVDITGKPEQVRTAAASGKIYLDPGTINLVSAGQVAKGDVFAVARVAGIQAAKQTSGLIPLCHQLQLTRVSVDFSIEDDGITVTTTARCTGKTGVEMEALTAASVALLTIYDMCKAVDKAMTIGDIKLLDKQKQDAH